MKKVFISFATGVVLTLSTTALASSEQVQAWLFPSTFQINGEIKLLGSEYEVLNYKDHAYVPVRFVSEQLGAGVGYNSRDDVIAIENEPNDGSELDKQLWKFKYKITPNSSQRDVKETFGTASYSNNEQKLWRYDISSTNSYVSNTINADTKAIQEGSLQAQIFIYWKKDNTFDRLSIWYSKNKKDIHIYNIDSNGSFSEAMYE